MAAPPTDNDLPATAVGRVAAAEAQNAALAAELQAVRGQLRLVETAALTANVGLAVVARDLTWAYANTRYGALFGIDPAAVVGQRADVALGAADGATMAKRFAGAFGGERVAYDEVHTDAAGDTRSIAVTLEPASSDSGAVTHVVIVCSDVTAHRRAEASNAEAAARFRLATEAARIGTFDIDLRARTVRYSPEINRVLGLHGVDVVALDLAFARIHRDDVATVRAQFDAALDPAGSGRLRMEFRFVRPGGEVRWMTWLGEVSFVQVAGRREPSRILGACADISDRKRAEIELRGSEARFRGVVEGSMQGIVIQQDEHIVYANPAMARIFGYERPEELVGHSTFDDFVAPEERPVLRARTAAVYRGERLEPHPGWRGWRRDGREIWVQSMAHEGEWRGRPAVVSFYLDITERKHAEDRQTMLTRELDHRVKNTLARVLVTLHRSAERASSAADLARTMEGRIEALAEAHSQLSRRTWHGANLRDLIAAELEPYATDSNVAIDGDEVLLSPEAAQAIVLVLHELATNAAKYGSLSVAEGTVAVAWQRVWQPLENAGLVVTWTERNGPAIKPPDRQGYGTHVITELVPYELDGTVATAFEPAGFSCRITLPVDCITDHKK